MATTEAQKRANLKYRQKRKTLSYEVSVEQAKKIKEWAIKKGFKNISSYLKDLVEKDIREGQSETTRADNKDHTELEQVEL